MKNAEFALRRLLANPHAEHIVASHRWPYEVERLHEFIHCLLDEVIDLPSQDVREVVAQLAYMGLLDPGEWNLSDTDRTVSVLRDAGTNERDAARATAAIEQAMSALQQSFAGKIQQCLRAIGEQSLNYLEDKFPIAALNDRQRRAAFSTWLQNTCNTPVSLKRDCVKEFCAAHDISEADLEAVADQLNLNVAVMDDLVHAWAATRDVRNE